MLVLRKLYSTVQEGYKRKGLFLSDVWRISKGTKKVVLLVTSKGGYVRSYKNQVPGEAEGRTGRTVLGRR